MNVVKCVGNKQLQLVFFVLKHNCDKHFYFVVAGDQSDFKKEKKMNRNCKLYNVNVCLIQKKS